MATQTRTHTPESLSSDSSSALDADLSFIEDQREKRNKKKDLGFYKTSAYEYLTPIDGDTDSRNLIPCFFNYFTLICLLFILLIYATMMQNFTRGTMVALVFLHIEWHGQKTGWKWGMWSSLAGRDSAWLYCSICISWDSPVRALCVCLCE